MTTIAHKTVTVRHAYQIRQSDPHAPFTIGGYGVRRIEQVGDAYRVYFDDTWYAPLPSMATLNAITIEDTQS